MPTLQQLYIGRFIMQLMAEKMDQTDSSSSHKSYIVLFTVEQRYHIMDVPLDKATFWKLFVCWDIQQKEVLMAKTVSKRFQGDDDYRQSSHLQRKKELIAHGVRNQVALLEKLSHESIPKLRGYCDTEQSFCLLMDYCPRGSLQSIVAKQGPLSLEVLMPLWRQLVRVVYFLHCKGIVHRDISPRNIYINQEGKLQLLNFSSAFNINEQSTSQKELLDKNSSMAPEIFAGQRVTVKIDVWSMGITLFYMVYGCSPWPNVKEADWHRRLGSTVIYHEGFEVSTILRQCIEKMLVYDAELRIGTKELAKLFGA